MILYTEWDISPPQCRGPVSTSCTVCPLLHVLQSAARAEDGAVFVPFHARRHPLPRRSELGRAHGGTRLGRRRGGEDPGQTRDARRKGPVPGGVGQRAGLLGRKKKQNCRRYSRETTRLQTPWDRTVRIPPPPPRPLHGVFCTSDTVRKHL